MTKRILTMLLAVLFAAVCLPFAAAEEDNEFYIYTENGNPLNLRDEPNGEIIGRLECGAKVKVETVINENWAMITAESGDTDAGETTGYVNRRFLVKELPKEAEDAADADYTGDELAEINAEFSAAKAVTPYRISVRPARVTSWATMRWTPGPTGMVINRYRSGDKLTVLKELKHYLQVQDPLTGDVGYMEKAYAVRDSMD